MARVKALCVTHKISLLVIIEPEVALAKLLPHQLRLRFHLSASNEKGNIWVMAKQSLTLTVVDSFDEPLSFAIHSEQLNI